MEGLPSACITLKVDVVGPENIPFCGGVRASFNLEILQVGAVKGLSQGMVVIQGMQRLPVRCLN